MSNNDDDFVVIGGARCPQCKSYNVDMVILESPTEMSDLIRHTCNTCGKTEDVLVKWERRIVDINPEMN